MKKEKKCAFMVALFATILLLNDVNVVKSWYVVAILLIMILAQAVCCENIFLKIAMAIMCFLQIELSNHNRFAEMKVGDALINIITILGIIVLCSFVGKSGIIAFSTIYTIICIAIYYVYEFRKIPLTVYNLFQMGTALDVIDRYEIKLNAVVLVNIFFYFCMILMSIQMNENSKNDGNVIERKKYRGVVSIGIVLGLYLIYGVGIIKINAISYDMQLSYNTHGFVACTLKNLKKREFRKPKNYSEDNIKAIVDGLAEIDTENQYSIEQAPNILLIVDESFYDLQQIKEFDTDIEITPFINSLDNAVRGYAVNPNDTTADSEYEILTENSTYTVFGTTQFIQQDLSEVNSIVRNLKRLGYVTYGFHTEQGKNYNRSVAYPALGFDHSYFLRETYADKEFKTMRGLISDEECFDEIIRILESDDEKKFIYCLTVQNHGGYTMGGVDYNINITEGMANSDYLREYLTCLNYTDQAFEKLVSYLEHYKEPTVVCFLGDHAPTFSYDLRDVGTMKDKMLHYGTPLIIWANYDIEEKDIGYISMNYIGEILFEVAGLPLTSYQKYIKEMRNEFPVVSLWMYVNKNGEVYAYDDYIPDIIENYQILEYLNVTQNVEEYMYLFNDSGEQKHTE